MERFVLLVRGLRALGLHPSLLAEFKAVGSDAIPAMRDLLDAGPSEAF